MGRMDRINELMKRTISEILQREISDPRLEFVTITAVRVTADLQQARVSFSFLGPASDMAAVKKSLQNARGYIRRLIGQQIELRRIPEIEFVYDESIEQGARIEQALEDIRREMPFKPGGEDA